MIHMFAKKRTLVALGLVAVLALAGAAFAYFSSTGSGTGSASVGSSTAFTVTPAAATGGPLYPGAGSESIAYTVKNPSSGNQNLAATTATVASSGLNITSGGNAVPGCLASWFTAANTPPAYGDMAGGASVSGSVTVTMQDASASQDPCQGKTPDITISAS